MLPSTPAEPYRARIRLTLDSLLQTLARIDQRLFVYIAALFCIPLSFIVYWPILDDFFVWDDFVVLRAVRDRPFWDVVYRAFTFPAFAQFNEATTTWRPQIDLYFYLAQPAGIHAQPYHIVNVLLHGVVGGLGVLFVWRLTKSVISGLATGLLFAVVPTYDFAVTWIVEVSGLLCAALILIALLAFFLYLTSEDRKPLYWVITFAATLAAVMTKEAAVVLLLLLPALVVASGTAVRRTRAEVLWSLTPPVLLLLAFAGAMEIHEYTQENRLQSIGLHMPRNLWRYLKWIVLPYRPDDFLAVREALAALFLVAGVASIVLRQRVLAFLFLWTVVAVVPFTGFDEWIEYRYTYLATLPFIAFVVASVFLLVKRLPRPTQPAVGALLAITTVVALVITPFRTRDQQEFLARESANYEMMVNGVLNLCGSMEPESYVYVVGAPYRDLWGIHTPAALNLYYDHVHASAVPELPGLAAFIEDKCVIQYDAATRSYIRTAT